MRHLAQAERYEISTLPKIGFLKSGYRRIIGPELAQRKAERRDREKNKHTAFTPEIRDLVDPHLFGVFTNNDCDIIF
ncbi:MAG TPA: hypothetical protein VFM69_09480 [Pricia sp.]|nr:hypothetical protein [Pricia sp.]